jgi:hypothetical protein
MDAGLQREAGRHGDVKQSHLVYKKVETKAAKVQEREGVIVAKMTAMGVRN